LAVASSHVFLFLPLQMEVIYWFADPDWDFCWPAGRHLQQYSRYDGRVIVATHDAGIGYSDGGDCAVDHADAAAAAVRSKNYFYIVRQTLYFAIVQGHTWLHCILC
jgi:hypothetical protein